jgi:hypothetical protein
MCLRIRGLPEPIAAEEGALLADERRRAERRQAMLMVGFMKRDIAIPCL